MILSVPLTNGSGSGAWRLINIRIRIRPQIRNTACASKDLMFKFADFVGVIFSQVHARGVDSQPWKISSIKEKRTVGVAPIEQLANQKNKNRALYILLQATVLKSSFKGLFFNFADFVGVILSQSKREKKRRKVWEDEKGKCRRLLLWCCTPHHRAGHRSAGQENMGN